MRRFESMHGFTLVETLVSIGIIGLLIGLLAMGVQNARESARRLACQNNLHQVGIAVTNIVGYRSFFPALLGNRGGVGGEFFDQTAFVSILPELEVNGEKAPLRESQADLPPAVLACPSANGLLGYRFCFGTGVHSREHLDGIFRVTPFVKPATLIDGLSNTVIVSERVSGEGEVGGAGQKRPAAIALLRGQLKADDFLLDCNQISKPYNFVGKPGVHWRGHQPVDVGYNHHTTPNSKVWDCQGETKFHLLSARSLHSGGVFALNADSSVHWVSSTIDLSVWRAQATVAGQD